MQRLNDERAARDAALQATALATGLTAGQVAQILRLGREYFEQGVAKAERAARKQARHAKATGNR
jgi:ABC-type transporter Mla subunit MlaD